MKTSQGDVFRRRENLLEQLKEAEYLTINELADFFNVSTVTIRRDLLFLEKKKMIERLYGGVRLLPSHPLQSVTEKEERAFPVETFIKQITPLLVEDRQLFVGAGRFSTELIYALSFFKLMILTNDAAAISIDHPKKKALISISGGELEKTHRL
ncbi:DeoR family transcriptional regulator [Enterococcus sp. AZ101]|uniref:DeoR family transcriptional regulator n=1 Tax=Enterococcus sp. AZ101 TaxID=2774742 RepID=UPI003D29634D